MTDEAARFWHWHAVRWAGGVIGYVGFCGWLLARAYGRYLRFASPWSPDTATGQVIHLKAGDAMFYVKPVEAFLAEGIIPFAWATAALGVALFIWAGRRPYPIPRDEFAAPHVTQLWRITMIEFIGLLLAFVGIVLIASFGDQLMSFIATGSFATPAERA